MILHYWQQLRECPKMTIEDVINSKHRFSLVLVSTENELVCRLAGERRKKSAC